MIKNMRLLNKRISKQIENIIFSVNDKFSEGKIYIKKISINSSKQNIYLFSSKKCEQKLALREIRHENKLREYINCKNIWIKEIFPKIYYINKKEKLVLGEWIDGERIANFKTNVYPKTISLKSLENIADLMAKIHSTILNDFSPIEFEPVVNTPIRNTLKTVPKKLFFSCVAKNFEKVSNIFSEAKNNCNIKQINFKEIDSLINIGINLLKKNKAVIETIPFFSLLHGDTHPENIILKNNKISFIDFENMHYGDRAWELAFFLEEGEQVGYINNKIKSLFLSKYQESFRKLKPKLNDKNLKTRIEIYKACIMIKFLALICNGLASSKKGEININLYNNILQRLNKLIILKEKDKNENQNQN